MEDRSDSNEFPVFSDRIVDSSCMPLVGGRRFGYVAVDADLLDSVRYDLLDPVRYEDSSSRYDRFVREPDVLRGCSLSSSY